MSTERALAAMEARADRPGWEARYYADTCTLHHSPVNDLSPHTRYRCPCKPTRTRGGECLLDGEVIPCSWMVWHNAFDGRDLVAMVEAGVPLEPPSAPPADAL